MISENDAAALILFAGVFMMLATALAYEVRR